MSNRNAKDKRVDTFAKESFKLGTLQGFRHFRVELRGREELLLMIDVPHAALAGGRIALVPMSLQNALAPASPCQRERAREPWDNGPDETKAVTTVTYLIAGYAHYACPHTWVRAGHSLFGPSFQSAAAMDAPVDMRTTAEWRTRTVQAFEFVAELVIAFVADIVSLVGARLGTLALLVLLLRVRIVRIERLAVAAATPPPPPPTAASSTTAALATDLAVTLLEPLRALLLVLLLLALLALLLLALLLILL